MAFHGPDHGHDRHAHRRAHQRPAVQRHGLWAERDGRSDVRPRRCSTRRQAVITESADPAGHSRSAVAQPQYFQRIASDSPPTVRSYASLAALAARTKTTTRPIRRTCTWPTYRSAIPTGLCRTSPDPAVAPPARPDQLCPHAGTGLPTRRLPTSTRSRTCCCDRLMLRPMGADRSRRPDQRWHCGPATTPTIRASPAATRASTPMQRPLGRRQRQRRHGRERVDRYRPAGADGARRAAVQAAGGHPVHRSGRPAERQRPRQHRAGSSRITQTCCHPAFRPVTSRVAPAGRATRLWSRAQRNQPVLLHLRWEPGELWIVSGIALSANRTRP